MFSNLTSLSLTVCNNQFIEQLCSKQNIVALTIKKLILPILMLNQVSLILNNISNLSDLSIDRIVDFDLFRKTSVLCNNPSEVMQFRLLIERSIVAHKNTWIPTGGAIDNKFYEMVQCPAPKHSGYGARGCCGGMCTIM
jgi:hypothetical protein